MGKSLSRMSLYSGKSTAQMDAGDEVDRRMSSKDSALSRKSSKSNLSRSKSNLSRKSSKSSNLGDQPLGSLPVAPSRSTDRRLTMGHELTSELGRSEDSFPMWQ